VLCSDKARLTKGKKQDLTPSFFQMRDFQLLRHGFSPEQITQLNLTPNDRFHWTKKTKPDSAGFGL